MLTMEPNYGYTPQAYTQPDPSPPEPPKKNRTVLIVSIIAAAVVLVAAIVAGAIVLSSGGGSTAASPHAPTGQPVATSSSDDLPDSLKEQAFYQAVTDQDLYLTSPRADVIELGHTICTYLGSSKDFGSTIDILSDQLDSYDAAYMVGAAVASFCPELDYLLPN